MVNAYLLLGGNKGNVRKAFSEVYSQLEESGVSVLRRSALYSSPAWGFTDPDPFLNQVLEIRTGLPPEDILRIILRIEKALGRIRSREQRGIYSARTIDIDILLFGQQVISTPELEIPHPRMAQRRFALLPLCELVPAFRHPGMNITIEEMLAQCPDHSKVVVTDEV